jgi:hypothetical protein
VLPTQNNKTVTIDAGFDLFDTALAGQVAEAMTDANFTVPTADAQGYLVFVFTGTLTADRNVLLPASKKEYIIRNNTTGGFNLLVQVTGGTIITVNKNSGYVSLYCDGTNCFGLMSPGTGRILVTATATTVLNAAAASSFRILLSASITTLTINNPTDGQILTLHWVQDATGSRTVVFPATVQGATAPGSTLNTSSVQSFIYDATDAKWYAIAAGVTGM